VSNTGCALDSATENKFYTMQDCQAQCANCTCCNAKQLCTFAVSFQFFANGSERVTSEQLLSPEQLNTTRVMTPESKACVTITNDTVLPDGVKPCNEPPATFEPPPAPRHKPQEAPSPPPPPINIPPLSPNEKLEERLKLMENKYQWNSKIVLDISYNHMTYVKITQVRRLTFTQLL
jgi:hypothetical protein